MNRTELLKEKLGPPSERAQKKVLDYMVEFVQNFIAKAPFAVLATSNREGDCDASPKGGVPGFIKVLDDRTLLIPDLGGNRLFQSYDNVSSNPKAALIFMIPGQDVTVRVNGRVRVAELEELESMGIQPEVRKPDSNSGLVQGLILDVDESYFHCPRAFRFAELWNTDVIEANRKISLKE